MNKPLINVLRVSGWPIVRQLQAEEALLRADTGNWCLINEKAAPAVVLGISSKPEQHLNLIKLKQSPIPVFRRYSGGGSVVIDHDTLFVTLIANEACSGVSCRPDLIMKWNGQLYSQLFKDAYQVVENDFTYQGRKFGGNAQYLTKRRWLQHTSLLWDFTDEMMDYLQHPPKSPKYRDGRLHGEFLCRLKEVCRTPDAIFSKILARLSAQFKIHVRSENDLEPILALPHRQTTANLGVDMSIFTTKI